MVGSFPVSSRHPAVVAAAFAMLLCSRAVSAAAPRGFEESWSRFAELFRELLDEQQMVGGAVWFLHGGDVLARESYGLADVSASRAVDEDTIFHWASVTKTLTGVAILQLRDRRLLDLDDPVVKYLPELSKVHNPFGGMEAITIRHVLTHSAGFRASTWPFGGDEPWHPFEPAEWSQLVAMFPYTRVLFEPGSGFSYSNPAIIFLGRIIEELSGEDYEVYVDKNLFRPLGMDRSYFDLTPRHLLPHRSNSYYVGDGGPRPNGLDFDTGITVSNSGWNAPLGDVAKLAAFLTGASGARGEDVLKRSSLQEMWTKSLPMTDPVARAAAGVEEHVGLIFFVSEKNGRALVGHTGSQRAFHGFLYFDPETSAAAVAAFNAQGVESESGGLRRPDAAFVLTEVRETLRENVFSLFHR